MKVFFNKINKIYRYIYGRKVFVRINYAFKDYLRFNNGY
jgi:hypothetical protein